MSKFAFPHKQVELVNNFFNEYERRAQIESTDGSFFYISLVHKSSLIHQCKLRLLNKDNDTEKYLSLYIKSLLWVYGGSALYLSGEQSHIDFLKICLSTTGSLSYEFNFFKILYGHEIFIYSDNPPSYLQEVKTVGLSIKGLRVGLDLGCSSVKVVLVNDGTVIRSDIIEWDPASAHHGDYILEKVLFAVDTVCPGRDFDSLGISTAGVVLDNELEYSSLYRSLNEKINLISILKSILDVPVNAINDGDAAALAFGEENVLALALGSDLGGGYLDSNCKFHGYLNELAFLPLDLNEEAPKCEWSGFRGTAGVYLSKRGRDSFELSGLDWFQYSKSMGYLIAHSIPWYLRFYNFSTVALYGGIASTEWGELMALTANEVLSQSYFDISQKIKVVKSTFDNERFLQAIAAAKLDLET